MDQFKVGDKVKLKNYTLYTDYAVHSGQEAVVIVSGSSSIKVQWADGKISTVWEKAEPYKVANKESNMKPLPEFIRLSRNTELFKKGSVFKLVNGTRYEAVKREDSMIDGGSFISYNILNIETVLRLPNTFVPVVKFNPEYVTEAENKALQATLKKGVK